MARVSDDNNGGGGGGGNPYDWEKYANQGKRAAAPQPQPQYNYDPTPQPANPYGPNWNQDNGWSVNTPPPPPAANPYGPNFSAMRSRNNPNILFDAQGRWVPGNAWDQARYQAGNWANSINQWALDWGTRDRISMFNQAGVINRTMPDNYMALEYRQRQMNNPYNYQQAWQAQQTYNRLYPNMGQNWNNAGGGTTPTQMPDRWMNNNPYYRPTPTTSAAQQIYAMMQQGQRQAQTQPQTAWPTPPVQQNYIPGDVQKYINGEMKRYAFNIQDHIQKPSDWTKLYGYDSIVGKRAPAGVSSPGPNFKPPPPPPGGGWGYPWGYPWGGGGGGGGAPTTPQEWYEQMTNWNFGR